MGRVCEAGVCVGFGMDSACETECGAPDQPCCGGGDGDCQSGLDCNDGTCEGEPCGAVGLACCDGMGMGCFGGAECVAGTCEAAPEDCGGMGEP
ncbi:MAG TPA: hypothetical protein VI197_07545, partial [Polyangiaceae bacterium]